MVIEDFQANLYMTTSIYMTKNKIIPVRHSDREQHQAGDYYDGKKRYYDNICEHTIVKLYTGDCYVTAESRELLVTILGSCVAVCARDPIAKVGGMNHILLPGTGSIKLNNTTGSTRYGAFAMEKLINGLIKLGGRKSRIETKIFGGSQVMRNDSMIGNRNIKFVEEYLHNESIPILAKDVGGDLPRRIHYFPDTGKVRLRRLRRKDDLRIAAKEREFVQTKVASDSSGEIEIFS